MPVVSQSVSIPAPVGGWNARDSLALMPQTDAITLENFIPTTQNIEIRNGYRVHATGLGAGVVQSLLEFNGQDGTRKLIAAANDNLYDATTYDAAATSLKSGLSSNEWEGVNYRNVLILCNGQDQPQQYNGTTMSDATYTGITDDADLQCPINFNSRLYFYERGTASVWYGAVDTITGALTEFDVQSLLKRGGFIKWINTWSRESGDGLSEYFVICSSQGEILLYSGTYPGDSSWTIVGRYYLPVPLGKRSFIDTGSDLMIITEEGVIPMSSVISAGGTTTGYTALSDKIRSAFTAAARSYKNNFGWQGVIYPRRNLGVVNIPVTNGGQSHQYIINTLTGAWAKWTGITAQCWCLFQEKLYFGGTDGKVYEFDASASDNGSNIELKCKTAFNYMGNLAQIKRFVMGRPVIRSSANVTAVFDIHVDFEEKSVSNTASITGATGATWDEATWDVSSWVSPNLQNLDWYALGGIGRNAALVFELGAQDLDLQISAFDVIYEPGGYL